MADFLILKRDAASGEWDVTGSVADQPAGSEPEDLVAGPGVHAVAGPGVYAAARIDNAIVEVKLAPSIERLDELPPLPGPR